MPNLLTLVKYIDRAKMTPEAAQEIASAFSISLSHAEAEDIATAYRTRGVAGLLPYMPALTAKFKAREVEVCPHCGRFII